jgi:hypothetical protein
MGYIHINKLSKMHKRLKADKEKDIQITRINSQTKPKPYQRKAACLPFFSSLKATRAIPTSNFRAQLGSKTFGTISRHVYNLLNHGVVFDALLDLGHVADFLFGDTEFDQVFLEGDVAHAFAFVSFTHCQGDFL